MFTEVHSFYVLKVKSGRVQTCLCHFAALTDVFLHHDVWDFGDSSEAVMCWIKTALRVFCEMLNPMLAEQAWHGMWGCNFILLLFFIHVISTILKTLSFLFWSWSRVKTQSYLYWNLTKRPIMPLWWHTPSGKVQTPLLLACIFSPSPQLSLSFHAGSLIDITPWISLRSRIYRL